MAVTYGFFNSVNGDRKYNAEQMSEYFRGIVNEGVFQHLDGGLAVTAGTGLAVSVASGRAIIQNRWVQNSDAMTLSISAASETYARKDAVVVRLNYSTRSIEIAVKAGTPAASPVAPSMTRNSTTYEMALAYVNVAANATSVTVTDKRSDSTVCGWVTVAQSTSGEVDAQLNAMKTGFDGVTYPSPVAMVQGCDQKLQDEIDGTNNEISSKNDMFCSDLFIRNSDTTNIFNKYTVTYNAVKYYSTGAIYVLNDWFYSDYMPVDAGDSYILNASNVHICYYDENKDFISGQMITTGSKVFTPPTSTVYCIVSAEVSYLPALQIEKGTVSTPYKSYYQTQIDKNDLIKINLTRNFNRINNFNPYTVTKGGVIYSGNGKYIATSDSDFYSDFMPVVAGATYQFAQIGNASIACHIAWFDSDKAFLSGDSSTSGYLRNSVAPSGAAYVIFSAQSAYINSTIVMRLNNISYVSTANNFQPYYIDKLYDFKKFAGKKVTFIGDSITFGVGCEDYVSDKTLMLQNYVNKFAGLSGANVVNLAMSGATLANNSSQLYASMIANIIAADLVPSDSDYIVIFGGTNDYWLGVPLGADGDTSNYTFYGAFDWIFKNLPQKATNAKVLFITPYQQWRNQNGPEAEADADGGWGSDRDYFGEGTLKDYRDVIIKKSSEYGCPVLDLYSIMPSAKVKDWRYIYTAYGDIHPNNNGHTRIAEALYNFMVLNM